MKNIFSAFLDSNVPAHCQADTVLKLSFNVSLEYTNYLNSVANYQSKNFLNNLIFIKFYARKLLLRMLFLFLWYIITYYYFK